MKRSHIEEYTIAERPSAYIPMDRRQSILKRQPLPDRLYGAALFADISGFTPLTEALTRALGPQRGAEVLTQHLNHVYDALITELHRYGGSVMGFAGDAITCWFDGDEGHKAATCALKMQAVMDRFKIIEVPSGQTVSLAIKIAVATGEVRRFLVGEPNIQVIDVLAGSTLEELSAAEKQANKGDVVLSPRSYELLGDIVTIREWRTNDDGQKIAVIAELNPPAAETPWPTIEEHLFTTEQIRPWLLPPVYERLQSGQGEFLAELRPGVALFLLFDGIDYDHDPEAGKKLDEFIRHVQHILNQYDGSLLQVSMGDKGSYLYVAFGAPVAHEDDTIRAVSAALGMRNLINTLSFLTNIQIGIASGRMRTGAYGGTMRRTYGVLGDVVNLSARLMQAATSNQILTTQEIADEAYDQFVWESLPDIKVKGKTDLISVAAVKTHRQSDLRLQEPQYKLPIVGREKEIAKIKDSLLEASGRYGQILGVTAEAGMGKSRLVSEIIQLAYNYGFTGYGGECLSYATNSSYFVWQNICRGFFGVDSNLTAEQQIEQLKNALAEIDPSLLPRLPLLGAVINLQIPDNDLTRSFDAKLRKLSLESLLVDCIRFRARQQPLFLVFEDCHWLDPLSHDLLEAVGRAIADRPVLIIMAYRPFTIARLQEQRINQLPHFTEIPLTEFSPQEAEQLIRLKLKSFLGHDSAPPPELVEQITARAEGNPFYIEELINYLQDQGFDPQDLTAFKQLELPDSLHSLILSRIDQLTETQKSIIKVASVIGRLFRAAMLWGSYPQLGEFEQIIENLETLSRLDLTPLDTPEPERTYLFKHVVTQEVAYENLPYAMRAQLHEQIGRYIERTFAHNLEQYIDLLAFHYERSRDEDKKREYMLKAGIIAQNNFANEAALSYYQRVLPLLVVTEKGPIMRRMGEVLQLVGRWKEAGKLYEEALSLAKNLNDAPGVAWAQADLAEHLRKQGQYDQAAEMLEQAKESFAGLNNAAGVGQVLKTAGTLAAQQGNLDKARTLYTESLEIHRQLKDKENIANLLSNLGIVARFQGNYDHAQALYEEGLDIRTSLGNKSAVANSLNNLGVLALHLNKNQTARQWLEQALLIEREVGDKWAIANLLNDLGNVARRQSEYSNAQDLYQESLQINQELGDRRAIAFLLEDIASLAMAQNQSKRSVILFSAAALLRQEIGAPLPPNDQEKIEKVVSEAREALLPAERDEAWQAGQEMPLMQAIEYALQDHV